MRSGRSLRKGKILPPGSIDYPQDKRIAQPSSFTVRFWRINWIQKVHQKIKCLALAHFGYIKSIPLQMSHSEQVYPQIAAPTGAVAAAAGAVVEARPRARVVAHLKQGIDGGLWGPGQPLPSMRTLSEELQVNRRTVRNAIELLNEEGIIRSNGGKMHIVTASKTAANRVQPSLMQHTVAVLTLDPDSPKRQDHQTGWIEFIARGAVEAVNAAGLHAMLLHPQRLLQEGMELLASTPPRGVVMTDIYRVPEEISELAALLRRNGIPFVAYGDAPDMGCDLVLFDHREGSYQLTKWLLARGRRRIFNTHPEARPGYWFPLRREGYEQAMREAGLEPLPDLEVPLVTSNFEEEEFDRAARRCVGFLIEALSNEGGCDALLAASDGYAFLLARAVRLLGKEPNRDVDIVGYDNYWRDLELRRFEPVEPLATVDKRNQEMGRQLVQLLNQRLAGQLPDEPQRRVVAPQLIVTSDA